MKLNTFFVSVQNKEISRPKAAGIFLQMIPKAVKTSGIMKAGFFAIFWHFQCNFCLSATADREHCSPQGPSTQWPLILMKDIYMSHQENGPPITDNNKKLCFLEFIMQCTMQGCLNIKQSPDNRHMYSAPISAKRHQKCLYYNMQINSKGKNYLFRGLILQLLHM